LSAVRAWAADSLAEPQRTFRLHVQPGAGGGPGSARELRLTGTDEHGGTLRSLGLVPAALLSLAWVMGEGEEPPPLRDAPVLRPELRLVATSLE
jgi:hypothetical protein